MNCFFSNKLEKQIGTQIFESNIPGQKPVQLEGYSNFSNYYANCQLQTKSWLLDNLTEDSVFIDVGANVGILSLTALRKIGSKGKVFSIEPTSTFDLLQKNLARFKLNSNIFLIQKAISDKKGNIKDAIYRIWGSDPEVDNYEFDTLDNVALDFDMSKVDVIEIDTDGYELEVLKGAKNILNSFAPKVIVEINEALATRGVIPSDIFNFFLNQRYTHVQDSKQFDWKTLNGLKFDSILIDGGHDFETVKTDTENAFRIASNRALIIWDDFNPKDNLSDAESGVMRFLTEEIERISSSYELFHFQGTQLLFGLRKEIV